MAGDHATVVAKFQRVSALKKKANTNHIGQDKPVCIIPAGLLSNSALVYIMLRYSAVA